MPQRVSSVLEKKGHTVVTTTPGATVGSVVNLLARNRIGAVPVTAPDGRLVGIISERDVIRGMGQYGAAALALTVDALMTREVETCAPEDQIVELMETMTLRRFRHLPVLRNGVLIGIVSIGDVVKQRLEEAQSELEALRSYIASA
ncbi:MAG: CBS domain-containing protein [Candidatus Binataceae bacterium]|nr:CBS domain-containing protein [Candidatus Binataceae bacterium]